MSSKFSPNLGRNVIVDIGKKGKKSTYIFQLPLIDIY